MKKNNRTVWTEGMFLGPQHFQQHDRFMFASMSGVHSVQGTFAYGFIECRIDNNVLAEGKFCLLSVKGVFSDGTPFSLPDEADLPDPITVSNDTQNQIVSLAIPFANHSNKEVAEAKSADNFSRYLLEDQTLTDQHSLDSDSEDTVFTGSLWTRLVLEDSGDNAFFTIPIARILEKRDDDTVLLDKNFYPCAASIKASSPLLELCSEIHALLHQRARELASRLGTPNASDTSQLTQLLLLQIINRAQPLFSHIKQAENDHPETLYRELLKLAGELSTITRADRVTDDYPEYLHRDQYTSFKPVIDHIRQSLNWIPDTMVESIAVTHIKAGLYKATVNDTSLFATSRFILAVKARVEPDELQSRLPKQSTICSTAKIRELVQSQARGVELASVVTVPNSIPMYENYVYFECRQDNPLWKELSVSGDIAIHIAGTYADLSMQFWAIQS